MILRRSVLLRATEGEQFATYVHARLGKETRAQMGKFAAILKYKTDGTDQVRSKDKMRGLIKISPLSPPSSLSSRYHYLYVILVTSPDRTRPLRVMRR